MSESSNNQSSNDAAAAAQAAAAQAAHHYNNSLHNTMYHQYQQSQPLSHPHPSHHPQQQPIPYQQHHLQHSQPHQYSISNLNNTSGNSTTPTTTSATTTTTNNNNSNNNNSLNSYHQLPQHQLHHQHPLPNMYLQPINTPLQQQQHQYQLQQQQYQLSQQQQHQNLLQMQDNIHHLTTHTPQPTSHSQQQQIIQPILHHHLPQTATMQSHHHTPQPTPQPQQQIHSQIHSQIPSQQNTPQPQLQQQHLTHHHLQQHEQQNQQRLKKEGSHSSQPSGELLPRAQSTDLIEGSSRKVAPRSSDLFRVGPPFTMTKQHHTVYCSSNDVPVIPIIHSRVDRGFEIGEQGSWIGYKRNYFTLVSSFTLQDFNFERFIQNKFYVYDKNSSSSLSNGYTNGHHSHHQRVEIGYFAIRLVAKCSDDDVAISLIQHTAKRDKGPQFPPPIYPAVPGELPDHDTVKASCNKRNGNKIESMNKIFYFDRNDYFNDYNSQKKELSVLKNYPSDSISRVARFERIQFTSSIRVKSTSTTARYFTLHVELLGIVEDDNQQIQPILLASSESPPLIIRGRSPSSYHKDRTSGYRPQQSTTPQSH